MSAAGGLAPQLHSMAIRAGRARDPRVACALVDLLARLGRGASGRRVLEEAVEEGEGDAVLWNKRVAMLAEAEERGEAISSFREMQARGVRVDGYACARALHACGRAGCSARGDGRARARPQGGPRRTPTCSCCDSSPACTPRTAGARGRGAAARRVERGARFLRAGRARGRHAGARGTHGDVGAGAHPSDVEHRDVRLRAARSRSESVGRCSEHAGARPAAGLQHHVEPSQVRGQLGAACPWHGSPLLLPEAPARAGRVHWDGVAKCGRLEYAQKVFGALELRNLTTWNSLVAGYANAGQFNRALELVEEMKMARLDPDITTWNGLITGYSMNGLSSQAVLLLRQIKTIGLTPNVVSSMSLISGSCHKGDYEDSFYFFSEMQKDDIQPGSVTMSVMLRACAGLALLKKGKDLHSFVLRTAYDCDMVVRTALIGMYSKAGNLTSAKRIFERIEQNNLVSYNAMLTGLAVHGHGREAMAVPRHVQFRIEARQYNLHGTAYCLQNNGVGS